MFAEHRCPICIVPCALCRSKARAVASGGDQLEANIQRAVKEVGECSFSPSFGEKNVQIVTVFLLLFRGVLMFVIWGVDDKTVNVSIIDLKFQGPPKHKI